MIEQRICYFCRQPMKSNQVKKRTCSMECTQAYRAAAMLDSQLILADILDGKGFMRTASASIIARRLVRGIRI